MKLKKYLISLLTIFIVLFGNVVDASTNIPSSFIVKGNDLYKITTSKYLPGGTYNFHFKKNTKGDIIYCIESHDSSVTSGQQTYTLGSELDAKYAYVLENGYPNKSITGNDEKDYFITGLSIFYLVNPDDYIFDHFDLNKGTYRGKSNDVIKEVAKLVNGAKKYSYTNSSIKLNTDSSLTLSDDKKYYVSSYMGVSTTGNVSEYTVSFENAPSGAIVLSENGNVKNTFSVDEKFMIKVAVDSISKLPIDFKVIVSSNSTNNKAYSYNPSDSSYQSVAVLYKENKKISDSAEFKVNLVTEVQISKIDATTLKELPGATLTVKDLDGNVKDSWVSTNEVHVIKGLTPGKYTLTEEFAPSGYELNTEIITFEVKSDGSVTKVVMENKLMEKVIIPITISKQDVTTKEELAGAHLEIKDESGNVVEAWVSTNEKHVIDEGLLPGKYYLSETLAPLGYELSTEVVMFIVKEDGTVDGNIIMYNKPEMVVEVPSTSSFKTITSSLIGIIIIGLGSMIIYKNYKKNEEY